MNKKENNASALLIDAEQTIRDNDYKHQLLSELLGQLKSPEGDAVPLRTHDNTQSPLASARKLIAERQRQSSDFNRGVESARHRRPLVLRGLLI